MKNYSCKVSFQTNINVMQQRANSIYLPDWAQSNFQFLNSKNLNSHLNMIPQLVHILVKITLFTCQSCLSERTRKLRSKKICRITINVKGFTKLTSLVNFKASPCQIF